MAFVVLKMAKAWRL